MSLPRNPSRNSSFRELALIAEAHGFAFVRYTGKGHALFRHANGGTVTCSSSPSDRYTSNNFERDCRRVSQQPKVRA